MATVLTRAGTDGRVYGGDPGLIHVPDGQRGYLAAKAATYIDREMRLGAIGRTREERWSQPLCPGCYMVVGFNMLVDLARRNGQPLSELGRTMSAAFKKLELDQSPLAIEEIEVKLDPEVMN